MKFDYPKILPFLAVLMSAVFWIADSLIDAWFLENHQSFNQSLVHPDDKELWMRCLVIFLMIIFALYAKSKMCILVKLTDELSLHKDNLEKLVSLRTAELEKTNQELSREIHDRKHAENELKRLATTDPLTSLFNRRKFEEVLDIEIKLDRQRKTSLYLIVCDIDNFKLLNDKHGHTVGDNVLREFSAILKEFLRESDTVARWGGEEFIILIPNTTHTNAKSIAEKLRTGIEAHEFTTVGRITASFGITNFMSLDTADTAIKRADVALYLAKERGRNKVELMLG